MTKTNKTLAASALSDIYIAHSYERQRGVNRCDHCTRQRGFAEASGSCRGNNRLRLAAALRSAARVAEKWAAAVEQVEGDLDTVSVEQLLEAGMPVELAEMCGRVITPAPEPAPTTPSPASAEPAESTEAPAQVVTEELATGDAIRAVFGDLEFYNVPTTNRSGVPSLADVRAATGTVKTRVIAGEPLTHVGEGAWKDARGNTFEHVGGRRPWRVMLGGLEHRGSLRECVLTALTARSDEKSPVADDGNE